LTKPEIRSIVNIMLQDLISRLGTQNMQLSIPDEVKDELAKEGYSPSYGARPLRRVIQRKIEDELSEQILLGRFKEGDSIAASMKDGAIVFEKTSDKPGKKATTQVTTA